MSLKLSSGIFVADISEYSLIHFKGVEIEQGRDTLARRRIPIVGLVPSFIFFAPPGYAVDRRTIDRLLYDY